MAKDYLLDTVIPRGPDRARAIDRVSRFLTALPAGTPLEIQVRERSRRRSDAQNKYLWAVVYKTICEHLPGWADLDVHEYCLGECYGWDTVRGLGKTRLKPKRRSKRLNKQEFADYVSFIQRRMAEHGIYVPDPNEDLERAA